MDRTRLAAKKCLWAEREILDKYLMPIKKIHDLFLS